MNTALEEELEEGSARRVRNVGGMSVPTCFGYGGNLEESEGHDMVPDSSGRGCSIAGGRYCLHCSRMNADPADTRPCSPRAEKRDLGEVNGPLL